MLVLFLFYHIITSLTLSLRYVSVSQWLKDKLLWESIWFWLVALYSVHRSRNGQTVGYRRAGFTVF